jgi:hypothetical protein
MAVFNLAIATRTKRCDHRRPATTTASASTHHFFELMGPDSVSSKWWINLGGSSASRSVAYNAVAAKRRLRKGAGAACCSISLHVIRRTAKLGSLRQPERLRSYREESSVWHQADSGREWIEISRSPPLWMCLFCYMQLLESAALKDTWAILSESLMRRPLTSLNASMMSKARMVAQRWK